MVVAWILRGQIDSVTQNPMFQTFSYYISKIYSSLLLVVFVPTALFYVLPIYIYN